MPILTFWQLIRGLMLLNLLVDARPHFSPLLIQFWLNESGIPSLSVKWNRNFNTTHLSRWGSSLTIWAYEGLLAAGEIEPEEEECLDLDGFVCVWRKEFFDD